LTVGDDKFIDVLAALFILGAVSLIDEEKFRFEFVPEKLDVVNAKFPSVEQFI
jgi:hypothetical protein